MDQSDQSFYIYILDFFLDAFWEFDLNDITGAEVKAILVIIWTICNHQQLVCSHVNSFFLKSKREFASQKWTEKWHKCNDDIYFFGCSD